VDTQIGLAVRSQLGPYLIEAQIGRGGMAVVYRARHLKLDRTVAIKLLIGYGSDEVALRRFQREAQTVARLHHPNILNVFDFGEEGGLPYMAMEYMPNGSLAAQKRGRTLSPADAVEILRPLAGALDYAHGEGVIHRDVKPSNVFLDASWRPVLADFGISKLPSEESLTATGTVTGTPAYMSPEQIKGGEVRGAGDIYSLAAMAYELLTGRTPFAGDDPWQVLYGHMKLEPPPPRSLKPDLPAAIDTVMAAGLAKAPEARWPTCTAMVDALEQAAGGGKVRPPRGGRKGARLGRRGLRRLGLAGLGLLVLSAGGLGVVELSKLSSLPSLPTLQTPGPAESDVPARELVLDSVAPLRSGGEVSFHGSGLDPSRRAVAGFLQDTKIYPLNDALAVAADGTFELSGRVPPGVHAGEASLLACNVAADGNFVPGRDCAKAQVQIR
jgi:serine/threonine protein kinase